MSYLYVGIPFIIGIMVLTIVARWHVGKRNAAKAAASGIHGAGLSKNESQVKIPQSSSSTGWTIPTSTVLPVDTSRTNNCHSFVSHSAANDLPNAYGEVRPSKTSSSANMIGGNYVPDYSAFIYSSK